MGDVVDCVLLPYADYPPNSYWPLPADGRRSRRVSRPDCYVSALSNGRNVKLYLLKSMVESLVQWTLLNNTAVLANALQFDFAKIIGQEITTDFGRLDFVLANNSNKHWIVELETAIDSKTKLSYCLTQTLNYKNVSFATDTDYCILYAAETSPVYEKQLVLFCQQNQILSRKYSLESTKKLYSQTVERLSLNVGLALPNPKNYTICYLRWLNKIMKPFRDTNSSKLSSETMSSPFKNAKNSKTNFKCYERIAIDFELIEHADNHYWLTPNGESFVQNMSPYIDMTTNVSSINLTNEQKRLLLGILTNGNWNNCIHKVNIYWFLRFIEVTRGSWLPKKHEFDSEKLDIANGLFNVSYSKRTMHEFLTWCSNYCIELGLIDRIKSTSDYDLVILTPLGIEISNIFSLDLTLKRSRMNLNFRYL